MLHLARELLLLGCRELLRRYEEWLQLTTCIQGCTHSDTASAATVVKLQDARSRVAMPPWPTDALPRIVCATASV